MALAACNAPPAAVTSCQLAGSALLFTVDGSLRLLRAQCEYPDRASGQHPPAPARRRPEHEAGIVRNLWRVMDRSVETWAGSFGLGVPGQLRPGYYRSCQGVPGRQSGRRLRVP